MEKWDKKESGIDSLIPIITKYLDNESHKEQIHHLNLNLTTKQLQKVSEALNE